MTGTKTAAPRTSRNSPYAADALFVTLHRSAAGAAVRWRTELAILATAQLQPGMGPDRDRLAAARGRRMSPARID